MAKLKWDTYALVYHRPKGEKGEDSYAYSFERHDLHALAVFDGCGGSGAWKYPEFGEATGAFVAAQCVSPKFLDWFGGVETRDLSDPAALARSLHSETDGLLQRLKGYCGAMGIVGGLVKSFPTTAACALVSEAPGGGIRITALNAGDSRVYYLTPAEGLVQVTRDDSRGDPDPLEALRSNPPLSTMLNADKAFAFTPTQLDVSSPCAVLAATDGVFGFVRSPMDFELLLLNALMNAESVAAFEQAFQEDVRKITGDDSTCVMSFYGWNSFDAIRKSLRPRLEAVKAMAAALDAAPDPAGREAEMRRLWEDYRKATLYYEKVG